MDYSFGKPKCIKCGVEIVAPNWNCASGTRHVVESKIYYMDDAPTDPGARQPGTFIPIGQPLKDSQTLICNVIPERRESRGHETIVIPGVNAQFCRGTYETADPEMQFWLGEQANKFCSRERWEQVYLTEQQKLDMRKAEVESMRRRLEQEHSDLLSQVKAKQKSA